MAKLYTTRENDVLEFCLSPRLGMAKLTGCLYVDEGEFCLSPRLGMAKLTWEGEHPEE